MILLGESGSGKTSLFNRIIYSTPELVPGGTQEPKESIGYQETSMCGSMCDDRYENCTKSIQVLGSSGNTTVKVCAARPVLPNLITQTT